MKGESFETLFTRSLLGPLKLNRSSYSVPPTVKWPFGVIPEDAKTSRWADEFDAFSPAGGNYMSLKDLSTVGRSILRSDLLSKAQTRRWMKPKSLLADMTKAVGMPWEIERIYVDGRTVDLYTKDGDWHMYDSRLVLVPDFDIGFCILTASDSATVKREAGLKVLSIVSDEIQEVVLPALESIAKRKAERAFAGSYASNSDGVSHSIVVDVDAQPGLKVTEWVYNGTDVLGELGRPWTSRNQVFDLRLQSNELYGGKMVGFTGVFGKAAWETVDLYRYGNIGVEQFAFEVDNSGVAVSVRSVALRDTLKRS
ncbi:hypothetical protein LTR36_003267 [Oleoguttula mirabilis]|uniref:Beta-lactamase-like ARB-00930-like C-terminal domain-containing protein n=1 Tax=Oleoguttula mirabilis TaxID=1507867 RepID=A0AAV9JYY7_9PEZI|nr:hypothetical protein LTR36_003267 [Oleoguttula mirabilis]